jgi:uncharacterized protein YjlB
MNINHAFKPEHFLLTENEGFHNNPFLPVVVYKNVLPNPDESRVKSLLKTNNWSNSWVNGIYDYHHYHSTTHEVLVALKGSCDVMLGGPGNRKIHFEAGDVLLLPAGIAHKNEGQSEDFSCLGAYPEGRDFDIKKGESGERPEADEQIQKTPIPQTDPVFGENGVMQQMWRLLEYDGL